MNNNNMTPKKFADYLNKKVCANVLEIIFDGSSVVDAQCLKDVKVVSQMLTFGFVFSYVKFKQDFIDNYDFPSTSNSKRVFDVFKTIYSGENIALDLMIYAITEMQMDVLKNGDNSYFRGVIAPLKGDMQIPSLREPIKKWLQNETYAEKNPLVILEMLMAVYHSFPFLEKIEVNYKKEEELPFKSLIEFINPQTEKTYPSFLTLVENDFGVYYLFSYEGIPSENNEEKTKLTYYSLCGATSCSEDLPTKKFNPFFKPSCLKTKVKSEPIFAKSFFSLSYRNIKNLSLAISDVISDETKDELEDRFETKYIDIFKFGKKKSELNWDNIITILMIDLGPSALLEIILGTDGLYFNNILKNLEMRYIGCKEAKNFRENVKKKYYSALENEERILKRMSGEALSPKNKRALKRSLMAKSIIVEMTNLDEAKKNKQEVNISIAESLVDKIKKVNKIINNTALSNSAAILKINRELEAIFRHIIPFYCGILAYQEHKEKMWREVVDESSVNKEEVFNECERRFFEAAKNEIVKIKKSSLGELIGAFRALCHSVFSCEKKATDKQLENSRLLNGAIGRGYVCSYGAFEKILKVKCDEDMDKEMVKGDKRMEWFFNTEKHSKPLEDVYASSILYENFLYTVKDLLDFLMYNQDYEKERVLGKQISYDPVYPFVVRYDTKSENRDGYNINSFRISSLDEGLSHDEDIVTGVKILSEREYCINEKYYCIPNAASSNSRWWIEPFLINCRKYDQMICGVFNEETNEEKKKSIDKET